MNRQSGLYLWVCCWVLFLTGCSISQPLFQDKEGKTIRTPKSLPAIWLMPAPVIQVGDKISVTVWGHPELSIGDVTGVAVSNESTGKWLIVDNLGEVKLPKIGKVKLAGYNIKEANSILELRFSDQLQNPIVLVRVLNHRVTVLGEVLRPNVYDLNNEVVTLVQIIGMSGGFTDYAATENVEIVRKNNLNTYKISIDLTSMDLYQDKNLILQPEDVVYVPPVHLKSTQKKIEKSAPVISILTSLTILLSLVLKN